MSTGKLHVYERPKLQKPKLLLGFSGWMDSGGVSTGTVKLLIEKLGAVKFAEIGAEGFYIQNFPGTMEMTAMFRPHTRIEDGLIKKFEAPSDVFFCDEKNDVILFLGREPNMRWDEFSECIYQLCSESGVEQVYFIGSVAGLVPHTREPRVFCSVSDERLKELFENYGVKFANYEGPASIVTYLMANAGKHGLGMASLIATVPAYVQGNNPKCIEAMTRRLASLLELKLELDEMRDASDEFEKRLSDVIREQPELEARVHKLEENYDNEIFDEEMGDLREWLEQKGVRLD